MSMLFSLSISRNGFVWLNLKSSVSFRAGFRKDREFLDQAKKC